MITDRDIIPGFEFTANGKARRSYLVKQIRGSTVILERWFNETKYSITMPIRNLVRILNAQKGV